MSFLSRFWKTCSPDRLCEWEKKSEREFIEAVGRLKTLSVTDRGGASYDLEEIREKVISSRVQLKQFVRQQRESPSNSANSSSSSVPSYTEIPEGIEGFTEVVAWRQLESGTVVRYMCLQSLATKQVAVATASPFSGRGQALPPWFDDRLHRQIATALQSSALFWYDTVDDAIDAWGAKL